MPYRKKSAKKPRRVTCDACGRAASKMISKTFSGATYHFDSRDCLLIFRKLRVAHGRNFFRKKSSA